MKHFTNRAGAALLALCLLLTLAACKQGVKDVSASTSSGSTPQGQSAPAAFAGQEIRMLTDIQGINGSGGPAGFYEIVQVAEDGNNIVYTDYATATRIFLCGRPECTHTDDSCTSWLPFAPYVNVIMANAAGDRLLYIGGGMSPQSPEVYGIFALDPNGANRREICRLESGQSVTGAVASDGQFLYFKRITVGGMEPEPGGEIMKLDLNTGALSSIATLEDGNVWLAGAFEDTLVIGRMLESEFVYTLLPSSGGKEVEAYRHSYSGDTVAAGVLGDVLAVMRKAGEATGDMVAISLRDGTETVVQTGLPMASSDTILTASHGSLMIWVMTTPLAATQACYALNMETGTLTSITLTTEQYKRVLPLWVLADAGDSLLVMTSQEETGTRTINDNAGNPYTIPIITNSYALISKADYLASRPNYTPITDEVPA